MMNRTGPAWAVWLVAACLLGCGSSDSPKGTYRKLWAAAKAGDRAAVMACYTRDSQAKLLEVEKLAADLGDKLPDDSKVLDVLMEKAKTVTCDFGRESVGEQRATLHVTIEGKERPVYFLKEEGVWKIESDLPDVKTLREGAALLKGVKAAKAAARKKRVLRWRQ